MFIAKRIFVTYLIIDFINLFILILFTNLSSDLNSIINLLALLFIFIPWFILSYFFDKYKKVSNKFIKILRGVIIKTFIITAINFLFIKLFINLNLNNHELVNVLKLFSKNFYLFLFLSNTTIQIFLEYTKRSFLKYQENWLCIGNFKIEENLIN